MNAFILFFILILLSLCFLNFILFFRNPVYAVFCFIFFIFFIILILLFLKAEFLAYLLLIIYVGAIAVLFLFTIILLNIKDTLTKKRTNNIQLIPLYYCFILIFFIIYCVLLIASGDSYFNDSLIQFSHIVLVAFFSLDINFIIDFFLSSYFLLFLCILILFIGIIGTALFMRHQ